LKSMEVRLTMTADTLNKNHYKDRLSVKFSAKGFVSSKYNEFRKDLRHSKKITLKLLMQLSVSNIHLLMLRSMPNHQVI
jgi:hypothetical protein